MEHTGGIYVAKRNGTCQHCGHHFFSSNPTPGPLCFHCQTSQVVRAKMQAKIDTTDPDPEPEPPAPMEEAPVNVPVRDGDRGTLLVGGYTITAPTFRDADQFDRAIERAFADGLRVEATDHPTWFHVVNPQSGVSYSTSRTSCSCKAGRTGTPCKHIAVLAFFADVVGELPAAPGKAA